MDRTERGEREPCRGNSWTEEARTVSERCSSPEGPSADGHAGEGQARQEDGGTRQARRRLLRLQGWVRWEGHCGAIGGDAAASQAELKAAGAAPPNVLFASARMHSAVCSVATVRSPVPEHAV